MFSALSKAALRALQVSALITSASMAIAATRDDELTVDPTMPLLLPAAGEDDEGGFFDLEGLGLTNMFTSYELSSVLVRAEDRFAVINGERVRVGDKVGSAIVDSIEADHVTLNVDGEVQTLMLYEDSIKTLVKGDE